MKKIIFLLLLSASAFASNTTTIADTYLIGGNSDVFGLQATVNTSMGPSFYKFNLTNQSGRLFQTAQFSFVPLLPVCTTGPPTQDRCWREIYFIPNNTWTEATVNNVVRPDTGVRYLVSGVPMQNYTARRTASLDFLTTNTPWTGGGTRSGSNQSLAMDGIYRNELITLFINGTQTFSPGSLTFFGTSNGSVYSREGSYLQASLMNFTLTDYLNGTVRTTDSVGFVEFDFETGFNSTENFATFDLDYVSGTNTITPNAGRNITMAFALVSQTLENDLATRIAQCYTISSYNGNPATVNPNGQLSYLCFNLSAGHGGKPFFGMIKVLNNSNVRGNSSPEFDFYWSVGSANYNAFQNPTYSPDPPIYGLNLTVTTVSNRNLNATMFYRYKENLTDSFGPLQSVPDNNAFGNVHRFTINYQSLFIGYYEHYFEGVDSSGTFTSATFNFTVAGPAGNVTTNSTLPGAVQSLVDGGWFPSLADGYYFVGALLLALMVIIGFALGGMVGATVAGGGGIIVLGLAGLLPIYVFIPVVVFVVVIIVKVVRHVFGSQE